MRASRLVAAALLCACKKEQPPPPPPVVDAGPPPMPAEREPNDRAEDATPLQSGVAIQGAFSSASDVDWYRLALPSIAPGQFLRIETSMPVELEARALSDAALLWSARTAFARNLSLHLGERPFVETPDGGDDGGSFHLPEPAGYYLVLKSRTPGAYTLTATAESGPADMEQEPNDDRAHATPLQTTATGYISPAGDQDWYRLSSDAGTVLHAELSSGDLAVYAGDKLVAREDGGVVPSIGLPPGDNFVLVRGAEDREHPYKLAVVLSPDDGSIEREPNNDVDTAQSVTLPASVKGWIWPRKDVDVFRFHVGAAHPNVNIVLSAVKGVDTRLMLYEIHGSRSEVMATADSSRGEGEEKILSVPFKEGDFAVEVSSPRNKDASATASYVLTIK
ncbi:MAG: hypothetical protein ABR567_02770 [Myxococcales bacterium]|nr:hypothetical protein [Myxococcales bacterium]